MSEPKIIRHTFDSGVDAFIHPVSPFTFRAVRQSAVEQYPYPDETPYRFPVENAAIEGTLTEARDSEEFQRLCAEVDEKRNTYIREALMDIALEFPDGREALIRQFAGKRERLKMWIKLPEDDWLATLWHCILTGTTEAALVIDIAQQSLPLSQEEVVQGTARYFRLAIQGQTAGALARQASGIPAGTRGA